ncbi:HisA/HisF-related TIM barrel protein [Stieleria varia]|uniref:1-(5-phosphoribosyl)-5-[(5-phosphoribosylamino)methylideneamino] imidazole-4-carboxamide isomerase n=1 Tax=Stieleria varia TaxID=2528005 RepID=A0A5C6AR54_9BACT|nr:HisA/HisF-related TIM barrel protein [Stieleria varia]TWU02513.1 1-(5-phosphoribosyl)-5-[(5-phosphoribosylamino)methylideneamino] imidazole-4-carboxamide isomerase [Stieleria varia]
MPDDSAAPFRPETIGKLVGVIDLKSGQAVHAVAGKRDDYRPIAIARGEIIDGDFVALASLYGRLGIRQLYLADLDGITSGKPQTDCVERLLSEIDWSPTALFWDSGWRSGQALESIVTWTTQFACLIPIIATECVAGIGCLERFVSQISPSRICLSMDFRNGQFVSRSGNQADWLAACQRNSLGWILPLDVSTVGTGQSARGVELCRGLKEVAKQSSTRIVSGGGVRSDEDVESYLTAGCDKVLVASALL